MKGISHEQAERIGLGYVLRCIVPASPYGKALARRPRVYLPGERAELLAELKNVAALKAALPGVQQPVGRLARFFMQLKDIGRTVERCREGVLNELELFELKRFLLQLELIAPEAGQVIAGAGLSYSPVEPVPGALKLLSGGEGETGATFYIPDGKSPKLKAARAKKRELELKIRTETSQSRLTELKAQRTAAAAEEDAEESRLRAEISQQLRPYLPAVEGSIAAIARLDFAIARAEFALKYGGTLPELCGPGAELVLEGMVNPRLQDLLAEQGRRFTPVSMALRPGAAVVTGANMGGKSVALKSLALNVAMVHMGILPTAERASMPLFTGVHIVAEDLENSESGLSSFGAEIVRFNQVMAGAQSPALILLDEFARGTNPFEGAGIVRSTVAYLNTLPHYSVCATHYDGVAESGNRHYQVIGLRDMDLAAAAQRIQAGEDGVAVVASCMDYGLFEVSESAPCPRDALNICRLLGLAGEILRGI